MSLKRIVLSIGLAMMFLLSGFSYSSFAENNLESSTVDYILKMNPGMSEKEFMDQIANMAKEEGRSEQDILKQIESELKEQEQLANEEKKYNVMGGSGGTKVIGPATRGYIFYTPASTWGLDHGHVGMYYQSDKIVESVPNDGVRSISAYSRLIENSGAVLKRVNTNSSNINAAVDWAVSRIGVDSYSYNFATNRSTSHYGDKNCSKLLWSAFILNAGIDIDNDKGLGVYPRDIRDSNYLLHVRNL